jgi:hypothetical protein
MVVLRLRGRTTLGATGLIVLAEYAERLRSAGGHLFLSGVQCDLHKQLQSTHRVDLRDAVTVVPASDTLLESTQCAFDDAEALLAVHAAAMIRHERRAVIRAQAGGEPGPTPEGSAWSGGAVTRARNTWKDHPW